MMVPGWRAAPPIPPPVQGPASPQRGEPGWTVWPHRVWPIDPLAKAPREVLLSAFAAAALAAVVWRPFVLSVGYLVTAVLVFAVLYGTGARRPTRHESVGIALTLALFAVPAVLAAQWLGVLCITAGWLVGWCTLFGGRTWTAVFAAPVLAPLLPARVVGWARRAAPDVVPHGVGLPKLVRIAVVAAITVVLVVVFRHLFAAADPAFAHVIDGLMPTFDVEGAVGRGLVFVGVATMALGGAYLLRFAPTLDAMAPAPMRPVPRWEWAVPLAVLDTLFVVFVAVQATVLFGGHRHVLDTEGLTYAEYARHGFWQLLWVSALTLLVLSVVIRVARRDAAADRRLLRILVGTLCCTSVVVVISTIHRMWLYQQAYGFSVQRIVVITIELWLGAVFVLVALAGIGMTARWLPRAVLVAGVVALLGLAALDPERLIADRNVDRYERTGLLDAEYLLRLSPDVEPALARLPNAMRECATYRGDDRDPWYEFNLSRSRAPHGGDPWRAECSQYRSMYS